MKISQNVQEPTFWRNPATGTFFNEPELAYADVAIGNWFWPCGFLSLCCTKCFSDVLKPLGVPLSAHAAPINGEVPLSCKSRAKIEWELSLLISLFALPFTCSLSQGEHYIVCVNIAYYSKTLMNLSCNLSTTPSGYIHHFLSLTASQTS